MWASLWNEIMFPIRRAIPRLRPGQYSETNDKGPLPAKDFLPSEITDKLARSTWQMSSYYSWVLHQLDWTPPHDHLSMIDLGSKNFFYAPALCEFFLQVDPRFSVLGLEADTGRTYVDLFKRRDYAHYYIKVVREHYGLADEQLCYQEGNWLEYDYQKKFDVVTSFFPFIYDDLNDGWGLPRRYFEPLKFYKKCAKQGTHVLLFHQGEEEKADSLNLISKIPSSKVLLCKDFGENPYLKREHPTWVILWTLS